MGLSSRLDTGPYAPADTETPDLAAVLAPGGIRVALQPVVRATDLVVVGHEALARMVVEPPRGPDWWLARAAEAGIREHLEVACLERAADLGSAPDGQLLFVNVSPSTIGSLDFEAVLHRLPTRLVLEVSECEEVTDYGSLRRTLSPILERGTRLAIDDTGAGYSSLRHVIELAPDFLKLDREMVRGLDQDPVRLALVRAMVAFSGEVGTHVIAEGVETREELEAVRDAGVHFVQGYLTGRPQFAWTSTMPLHVGRSPSLHDRELDDLVKRLASCDDAEAACDAVADHLARRKDLMPSIYLVRGGSLRCLAQRGLWQVLDGMPADAGITGRAWATGAPVVVDDVRHDTQYLEAIPGVVSEVCIPLFEGDRVIGAMNVESCTRMPADTLQMLEAVGRVLTDRLEEIGYRQKGEKWDAAAKASVLISGLRPGPGVAREALGFLLQAAGIDSGAVVLERDDRRHVLATAGPLAAVLGELSQDDLAHLAGSVDRIRSCYSAGDPSGRCFLGTGSLREGGARAVLLLPMWAQKRRIGTIVLAHSRPLRLERRRVEPLELLADHVAATFMGALASV